MVYQNLIARFKKLLGEKHLWILLRDYVVISSPSLLINEEYDLRNYSSQPNPINFPRY